MDYHIVRNTSSGTENDSHHRRNLHDWHFEAQLFGAGMVILLLPLVATLFNNQTISQRVLGASTKTTQASALVYDSEYGYVYSASESKEEVNVFTDIISSILQLFR